MAAVKRTQHGVIADPHTIDPQRSVADATASWSGPESARWSSWTPSDALTGLLTQRDVRFVPGDTRIAERMTARDQLVCTPVRSPRRRPSG